MNGGGFPDEHGGGGQDPAHQKLDGAQLHPVHPDAVMVHQQNLDGKEKGADDEEDIPPGDGEGLGDA